MLDTSTLSAIPNPNPSDSICHFWINSLARFAFLTAITTCAPDSANCLHNGERNITPKKTCQTPQLKHIFKPTYPTPISLHHLRFIKDEYYK